METNGGTGNENLPSPTLCRTGCGFYGNSQFDGMCSKCYKDSIKRRNQNGASNQLQGHISPTAVSEPSIPSLSSSSSRVSPVLPDVETASPTVPATLSAHENASAAEETTVQGAGAAEPSTSEKKEEETHDKSDKKPKKNRCHTCKKKTGLTGFECRCGGLFCGIHRYSDKHDCTFNYKELGQEQIRKNNPVVVGAKIQKI